MRIKLSIVAILVAMAFGACSQVMVGADQTAQYVPLLTGKRVAVVANQTSVIGDIHLVDSLLRLNIDIRRVFGPEHGFRGKADAGEHLADNIDAATGLPVVSLYGKHRKPTATDMDSLDLVIFDIQDVGVRFYTYISTLHYVMEACAENNVPLLVLDRPNPNGFYIDGPVLKKGNASFVGLHEVPVVYGMTIGEYAQMVNGEGWMKDKAHCELTVVAIPDYDRNAIYELPVKPSPNLPSWESIYLYPSLCFFEGSIASVGRGTDMPFQVFGHPNMRGEFSFTPQSKGGASKPLLEGQRCRGTDLTEFAHGYADQQPMLHLEWLIEAYQQLKDKGFFNNYFHLLAGDKKLQSDIESGKTADEIRASWQEDLEAFKAIRVKYLIY